jgi:uncharacterized iron-regulated protein
MKFLLIYFLLISQNFTLAKEYAPELAPYVKDLKVHGQSPVKYIASMFEQYDIIVFAERFHTETTQYELIKKLLEHPEINAQVSTVFIELLNSSQQPKIDELMGSKQTQASDFLYFHQNSFYWGT